MRISMKKLFLITFAACYLIFNGSAKAQSPTLSPTLQPPSENLNQQISDLKSRIASRVAQLKLVEKRGIIAKVTDVSDTQITVSDLKKNNKFIDVDELTRFSPLTKKESFGISDIAKGSYIGVLGLYNKESRRILARFVDVINLSIIVHGSVESIDKEKFVIKITSRDGKEVNLDIETTTKTFSYSIDEGFIRTGFSKIKENDRIIAIAQANTDEKNRATGIRITLLPEIPKKP